MADEPISALTLFTSYSTADEVEILDVSDTTFASTGTNKRIQFSTLLTMAGVGSVQNESASTILGNPTGSPAAPSAITLYPNMGFVGTSLRGSVPIWAATSAGTPITNSTSSTSIFTGASSIGSLTIPANTLQVGSRLRFNIFGALSANATSSPTLTIKFLLGGATLSSWTTPAVATTYSGIGWLTYESPIGFLVQAIGSSGKIIGVGAFNGFGWTANIFSNNALNAAPSQVTINTTISQAIDVQFQWSVASASESIQLLGGTIYLD